MKELEALKYISNFSCFNNNAYKDKLDAIKKGLKRNEPMQVKYIIQHSNGFDKLPECPYCMVILNDVNNYCPTCGQSLKYNSE